MSEGDKYCVSDLANAISGSKFEVTLSGSHSCNGKSCFIQFVSKWVTLDEAREDNRDRAVNEANNNGWPKAFAKGFVIGTKENDKKEWIVCFVSDPHDGTYAEFAEYVKSASNKTGGSSHNLDEFVKRHC